MTRRHVRSLVRQLWPAGAVVLVVVGLVVLAVLNCGCCGAAGTAIDAALEGAAVTMDRAERAEGDAAIDRAKTVDEARAALDVVRADYQPRWVALAVALQADLAYLQDCSALPALVSAYCALGKVAPKLQLPDVGVCP